MMPFDIYPAIDLRQGQVVRLQHGDPERQTNFSSDPVAVARRWAQAGASWLHVVNLDGAFDESGLRNWQLLPELTAVGTRVQFGGGIRSLKDIARVLSRGVSRVVLGTVAVEEPDIVEDAIRRFGPERIAVAIDARDGRVRIRGWKNDTNVSALDLGWQMMALGVKTVIFTDINRDGVLSGVNTRATADLARESGLKVIASGGVASLADIEQVMAQAKHGVAGVIIGRALYDGRIALQDALAIVEGANHAG